ncbi:MAG: AAA-like domain-containing protein [Eubacteriales bacterium]|nr:AAA-like domain-containing protein [Eubacteriales bacterium]
MGKYFNTSGVCIRERHYMADTTRLLCSIRTMVERGDYFVMNRARQFGKTTALRSFTQALRREYAIFSISLEGIGEAVYKNEFSFCRGICRLLYTALKYGEVEALAPESAEALKNISQNREKQMDFMAMSELFSEICSMAHKPVVLIIDEVDQASGYRVFLDFLGMLRNKYLQRAERPTFQSVILAGVHDIKNPKLKIRHGEEHKYNSPWNVAADFNIDMSFRPSEIAVMLKEYEKDYATGMDIEKMSHLLYDYTSGYPFLVSRLCQIMAEKDEECIGSNEKNKMWNRELFQEAVRVLLKSPNTLFDDMVKKLSDYPELKKMLREMLFTGRKYSYETENYLINIGEMFGFLKENEGMVCISNRIFEMKLYNLFISEEETDSRIFAFSAMERNLFIAGGMLQMDLVMKKFYEYFEEIYADAEDKFIEDNGRRIFLLYLKPIINGSGNYYVEARTRDMKRTDIIIDYKGIQNIVELKIWHGQEYNKRGEQQLFEYLEYYHKDKGYLLSFNFNKNKETGMKEIDYQGKKILEIVV